MNNLQSQCCIIRNTLTVIQLRVVTGHRCAVTPHPQFLVEVGVMVSSQFPSQSLCPMSQAPCASEEDTEAVESRACSPGVPTLTEKMRTSPGHTLLRTDQVPDVLGNSRNGRQVTWGEQVGLERREPQGWGGEADLPAWACPGHEAPRRWWGSGPGLAARPHTAHR